MTTTLSLPRDPFTKALQLAASVSPNRTTRDVLRFAKLTANGDGLTLESSDMEAHIRLRLATPDAPESAHESLWPIAPLLGFLRDTAGDEATLDLDGHTVTSDGDDMHFAGAGDPDEFPAWRAASGPWASLPASRLQELAARVAFAAASEAGRYAMHGVLLVADPKAGTLSAVATDGRRLARAVVEATVSGDEGWQAIIPAARLATIGKLARDGEAEITLTATPDQWVLTAATDDAALSVRLIDGEFPRYESVIPTGSLPSFTAEAGDLARKIRVVSAALGDDARAVRLRVEDGMLTVSGRSSTADARADLAVDGADMETAANPEYLAAPLKQAGDGAVEVACEKPTSPIRMTLGESWTYVVMPITLES